MILQFAALASAQSLTITGGCPGIVDATVTGLTPNGQFAAVTGVPGGSTVVPVGPCAGTVLDVGNAQVRMVNQANAQGSVHITPNVPAGLCGSDAQVLDLATCRTTPSVAIGNTCPPFDVAVANNGPSLPVMANPVYLGLATAGMISTSGRDDFAYTSAGQRLDQSATMRFLFLDANFVELCHISFDLSDAVQAQVTTTDVNGTALASTNAVTLPLSGGDSTCGYVDPNVWGTADLRNYLASLGDWSVAVQPMSASFQSFLQPAVVGAGEDWANDWAPYVFTEAFGLGNQVIEFNYAFSGATSCEEVALDPYTGGYAQPASPTYPMDGHSFSASFYVINL
ncbi:MAG: hypothetical protein H6738_12395 [Alphaproteobacteria bacterium]|nr:hypothetical protein [Alphaproteobacteria bacterium]